MKAIVFLILIFTTNISVSDTNNKLSGSDLNEVKNEVIKEINYQFFLIENLHFSYEDNVFLVEVLLKNTDEENIKTIKEKIETEIKNKKEIERYKQVIKNKKIFTIIEFNKDIDDFEKIINSVFNPLEMDSIEIISAGVIKEMYENIKIN